MTRRRPTFDPPPTLFGSEYEALSRGYAQLGTRNALTQGYLKAAGEANANTLRSARDGFLVIDKKYGPFARKMSYDEIYEAYKPELHKLGLKKAENLHHTFAGQVKLRRGQRLGTPANVPGDFTWNIAPDAYIAHSQSIKAANTVASNQIALEMKDQHTALLPKP